MSAFAGKDKKKTGKELTGLEMNNVTIRYKMKDTAMYKLTIYQLEQNVKH